MKNIQDIKQRDSEYMSSAEVDAYNKVYKELLKTRIYPEPSVVTQKRNTELGTEYLFVTIIIISLILIVAYSLNTGYKSGYNQAKIDYHIKS